jgi:hypothetical protein
MQVIPFNVINAIENCPFLQPKKEPPPGSFRTALKHEKTPSFVEKKEV